MNDTRTIKIPFDLARYAVSRRQLVSKYETNQEIKALGTWLLLKAETSSGIVQQWNRQKADLLALCKCTETIFRHRLRILQSMGLLKYDRYNIHLSSWDRLKNLFAVDPGHCFTIQYNLYDKQKIDYWIIAAEIQDNQQRQTDMILRRVNENADQKNLIIEALIKRGADPQRLKDPSYFFAHFKALYIEDFIQPSELHPLLIEIRADNNRSVTGIASAWNCRSAQTASYWKGVLKKAAVIDYSHLQAVSQDRARNKHCRVLWLKKEKQTLLCLCDQITLLIPWIQSNFLAA